MSRRAARAPMASAPRTAFFTVSLTAGTRSVSTGSFDHPPFTYRQQHTFQTLPMHDANRFGGRTAYLREIGPIDHKKRGRLFKRDPATLQFNVDIWCAQQSLRKRWKRRDWDVVEMPFELAPRELQRVVPEPYTDVPLMTDPMKGDFSNLRNKVYDREDMQAALFTSSGGPPPYPTPQRVVRSAMTLDKFL